jgi:hypothetical protein
MKIIWDLFMIGGEYPKDKGCLTIFDVYECVYALVNASDCDIWSSTIVLCKNCLMINHSA